MRLDPATRAHVYRRAGFGQGEQASDSRGSLDDAVQDLFGRREHEALLTEGVERILGFGDVERLQAWWCSLLLRDQAPLVERMALIWHGHFATSFDKVRDVRLMHQQIQLFRERGLGDFRELLHAMVRDPAMLIWLDGTSNKKGHPNENFARELFELFGLGIGHYGEADIREAARALSGHELDGRRYRFDPAQFDDGVKTVFGQQGSFDGDDVVDLVLAHPACPRHIAGLLLRHFAVPDPSDAEIETWSTVLLEAEWNIEATLERLFRSELFLGPRSRRSRIAAPVELLVGTALGAGLAREVAPMDLARAAGNMGQSLLRPPGVQGWEGGRAWIHAGAWLVRHNRLVDWAGRAAAPLRKRGLAAADLLDRHLPDGASPELRQAVEGESDLGRALGLVWTAPEYHLV